MELSCIDDAKLASDVDLQDNTMLMDTPSFDFSGIYDADLMTGLDLQAWETQNQRDDPNKTEECCSDFNSIPDPANDLDLQSCETQEQRDDPIPTEERCLHFSGIDDDDRENILDLHGRQTTKPQDYTTPMEKHSFRLGDHGDLNETADHDQGGVGNRNWIANRFLLQRSQ